MKKLICAAALLAAVTVAFAACGKKTQDEDTSAPSVTTAREGFEDITAPPEESKPEDSDNDNDTSSAAPDTTGEFGTEEAVEAARAYLGDSDPDSGFKYAYSFDEMFTDNGTEYFKIRVSWYIEEEERYSLCGYLLVSDYGQSIRKYNW